jgi:hypothetical protein
LSFDFDADLTEHAQDYTNNVIHDPGRQSGVGHPQAQSLAVPSQQISCTTLQPLQYAITTPTQKPGKTALTYYSTRSRYQYMWETDARWVETCRQLIVTLNDGTQHRANLQFVQETIRSRRHRAPGHPTQL